MDAPSLQYGQEFVTPELHHMANYSWILQEKKNTATCSNVYASVKWFQSNCKTLENKEIEENIGTERTKSDA